MVDVWQGYREGNRNLNAALDEYSANQRQLQLDEQNAAVQKLQMGLAQQNLDKGALDLAETQRKSRLEEGFRRFAAAENKPQPIQVASATSPEQLIQPSPAKDPIRLRIEYGMQQGDMQMVQDAKKQAYDRLTQIGARIGDSDEAMQRLTGMWNEMTGENVAYLGKRDKYNILQDKDTGKITAVNPQDPTDMILVAEGTPKQQKTEVRTMTSPDGKTKQDWIVDATTNERIKPFSQPYKVASQVPGVNVKLNAPSGDEVETLAQMIAKGEMVSEQLPRRQGLYNQVVARAKQINPQLNLREAGANYGLAKNPQFRQRAITAESLPEVMNSMVELGKKLDFPDTQFIGKVQKWGKGQINDPTLTEYMALRNDALMEIAQVMRGAGMTDMAHRAETEVSSPTMSPRALDAWLRAQNKALQPRIKRFNKVIGGNTSTNTGTIGKYTYTVE